MVFSKNRKKWWKTTDFRHILMENPLIFSENPSKRVVNNRF